MRPVILCGGKGTRLWPLSRDLYPKQFMELAPGKTLFRDTLNRLSGLSLYEPLIICNSEHRFMAAEQMRLAQMSGKIILEPEGRNTAPAVAVAALSAEPDDILLVLPADHALKNGEVFRAAMALGEEEARAGNLVCFGITPDAPETGYGYILRGERTTEGVFAVSRFVEKPDAENARKFLESGEYFWNSGMFMFKASAYLAALEAHEPEMLAACQKAVQGATVDLDFIRLDEEAFLSCPSDSIDYAVMEKQGNLAVVELNARWSDLGSWKALHQATEHDESGNACVGDVICEDTRNCYLHSSNRLVATVGLEDVVVVETADAVFVSPMSKVQDVKSVVGKLVENGRPEATVHPKVYRPWGSFETVSLEDRYQVKRITVKPGEVLSLQKHFHRAEHWVVVSGTAMIVNGEDEFMLSEDQSTYIPLGNVHRLGNPGKIPLELIEVQTGAYLGEDDIVRLEDVYKR